MIEFVTGFLARVLMALVDGWLLLLAYNYFSEGHVFWAAFLLSLGAAGIIQSARFSVDEG